MTTITPEMIATQKEMKMEYSDGVIWIGSWIWWLLMLAVIGVAWFLNTKISDNDYGPADVAFAAMVNVIIGFVIVGCTFFAIVWIFSILGLPLGSR